MNINTDHLNRCISTLRSAWEGLQQCEPGDVLYDIYRAACVKEFELVLEQSGRLLKRRLRPFFASNRQADQLYFNDIFRYAAKHCLISDDACERWLEYRVAAMKRRMNTGSILLRGRWNCCPDSSSTRMR